MNNQLLHPNILTRNSSRENLRRKKSARKSAFSLIEVTIAMAIATVLSTGVMQMFISVARINFNSNAKLSINSDVRGFTDELTQSARSAAEFRLYTAVDDLTNRESGETGDLLVLVWADPLPLEEVVSGNNAIYYYQRIIAFARVVDDKTNNTGPVMKYERAYPAYDEADAVRSDSTTVSEELTKLLNNNGGATESKQVVELSRGLATKKLFFYSRTGRSITVNGEIYHGNDVKRVTNTYNFTVNPRG